MIVFLRIRILWSLHTSKDEVLLKESGMKSFLIRLDSRVLRLFSGLTFP
jgi:hypothetical protein